MSLRADATADGPNRNSNLNSINSFFFLERNFIRRFFYSVLRFVGINYGFFPHPIPNDIKCYTLTSTQ